MLPFSLCEKSNLLQAGLELVRDTLTQYKPAKAETYAPVVYIRRLLQCFSFYQT
jgi:hypothetical protein